MLLCSVWIFCWWCNFVANLNGRLSYNKLFADCAGAIFYSMMKLALETPHTSASKFLCVMILMYTVRWRLFLNWFQIILFVIESLISFWVWVNNEKHYIKQGFNFFIFLLFYFCSQNQALCSMFLSLKRFIIRLCLQVISLNAKPATISCC